MENKVLCSFLSGTLHAAQYALLCKCRNAVYRRNNFLDSATIILEFYTQLFFKKHDF